MDIFTNGKITIDNIGQTRTLDDLINENIKDEIYFFPGLELDGYIKIGHREKKNTENSNNWYPKLIPKIKDSNNNINMRLPKCKITLKLQVDEKGQDTSYIYCNVSVLNIMNNDDGLINIVDANTVRRYFFELLFFYRSLEHAIFNSEEFSTSTFVYLNPTIVKNMRPEQIKQAFDYSKQKNMEEFKTKFFSKFSIAKRENSNSNFEAVNKFFTLQYFTDPSIIESIDFENIRIGYSVSIKYLGSFGYTNKKYFEQCRKLQSYYNLTEEYNSINRTISIDDVFKYSDDQIVNMMNTLQEGEFELITRLRSNYIRTITEPAYIMYNKWSLHDTLSDKIIYAEVISNMILCKTQSLGLSTDATMVNIFRTEVRKQNIITSISHEEFSIVGNYNEISITNQVSNKDIPVLSIEGIQTLNDSYDPNIN